MLRYDEPFHKYTTAKLTNMGQNSPSVPAYKIFFQSSCKFAKLWS